MEFLGNLVKGLLSLIGAALLVGFACVVIFAVGPILSVAFLIALAVGGILLLASGIYHYLTDKN